MDETKDQATTTTPARSIPVMDIQPPKPAVPNETPADTTVEVSSVATAPVEDVATEKSTAEASVAGDENSVASNKADSAVEPTLSPVTDTDNPMAVTPANAGAARHKAPVGVIVATLILAFALAGATVFAYIKTKQPTANNTQTPTQTIPQETTATPKVTSAEALGDVDKTSQDADAALKAIDENKDFSTTDLSDTTLGL